MAGAIAVLGILGGTIIGSVLAAGVDMPADKLWPRMTAVSVIALSIAAAVIWG